MLGCCSDKGRLILGFHANLGHKHNGQCCIVLCKLLGAAACSASDGRGLWAAMSNIGDVTHTSATSACGVGNVGTDMRARHRLIGHRLESMLLQKLKKKRLAAAVRVTSTWSRVHGLEATGVTRCDASARSAPGGSSSTCDAELVRAFGNSYNVWLLDTGALGDAQPDVIASFYSLNFSSCSIK